MFFNYIFAYIMCPTIVALVLVIVFSLINKLVKSILLEKILKIFSLAFLIPMGFTVFYMLINCFLLSFTFIYYLIFKILLLFLNSEISKFLSLLFTLSLGIYFPDKLGVIFLKLMERFSNNSFKFSRLYPGFARFLRLNIWVYFLAFTLTVLSSLEIISGRNIISYSGWSEIRPYIIHAVVSFIAFDKFMKLLLEEFSGIISDIKRFFSSVKDFILNWLKN